MKALLFRPGRSHELEEVEVDDPGPEEVLVRVVAAGVCHSDLHFMESRDSEAVSGFYGPPLNARMQPGRAGRFVEEREARLLIMGHEPSGVVEAVGSKVTSLEPGDRVIGGGTAHCGVCKQCLLGRPNLCLTLPRRSVDERPRLSKAGERVTQFANLGAFAEKMLVHETSLVRIDGDVPFASAAILGCSIITGVGAALNTAKVEPGSNVAVFGTGGVGLSIVQGARIAGAQRIVAVDVFDSKLELARRFGATDGVNSRESDPVEAIFDLTNGEGVDYSFDTTAVPQAAQAAYDCLGLRGCLTSLVGAPANLGSLQAAERRVQGSLFGSTRFRLDVARYLELYRQGRLLLDEMVSVELPPERFGEAVSAMEGGEVARAVLSFGG